VKSHLSSIGVFGFDKFEPAILASLVTEDPMMLIGQSGTGKTYLLNTLSEILGLEHRHYNASLISFDDLVGFPYPDTENGSVRFLQSPATVWGAESVLIDEISRCKPEHQNRLFSLVHERKIQGISLEKLRYRWSAMNPCSNDQNDIEDYSGSEPLDPALADRFSLFIWAVDWNDLSDEGRRKVAEPGGEGKIANDGGKLSKLIAGWRDKFLENLDCCPTIIIEYVTTALTALNSAGVRISPRRSRLISRSLLAATIVTGKPTDRLFKMILDCSLPHVAWGVSINKEVVSAAHRAAWDSATNSKTRWVHSFMAEQSLAKKLAILIDQKSGKDAASQAIAQFLASEPKERAAAFAFATYPAAALGQLPLGAEGINDLGKIATSILTVNGEISWQERRSESATKHPEFERFAKVLNRLKGGRLERARQFFNWCLVEGVNPQNPEELELDINACVEIFKTKASK